MSSPPAAGAAGAAAPAPSPPGPAAPAGGVCALCPPGGPPPGAALGLGPLLGPFTTRGDRAHLSCAEWAPEVFYDDGGALRQVGAAVRRGRQMRCAHCALRGATLGCLVASCPRSYHLACAAAGGVTLDADRFLAACPVHAEARPSRPAAPSVPASVGWPSVAFVGAGMRARVRGG